MSSRTMAKTNLDALFLYLVVFLPFVGNIKVVHRLLVITAMRQTRRSMKLVRIFPFSV